MRKIICLAACMLLLGAASAHAAESIVVFDLQQVAADSDALKEAKDILDAKFGPQKTELETAHSALEAKAAEMETERQAIAALPENQRARRLSAFEENTRKLVREQQEYSEKAQAFMRILQADEMRVRTELDSLINRAAENLAKRKGYSMILDSAMVPYFTPALNVTSDMLTEVNVVWKQLNAEARERAARGETPGNSNATAQ